MKNNCFSIEVGQNVVLRPTGNNRRGWDGNPVPGLITKIARKYFYVRVNGYGWSNQRFLREDFSCDEGERNAGYIIYESEDAFNRDTEYGEMMKEVRKFFSGFGTNRVSYDALKQIYELLLHEDLVK